MSSFGLRLLETLSYLVLASGAVALALIRPETGVGDGVDLYGTYWFYWWIKHCVISGTDPGFTDLMFHPLGKDIFAHTGSNFIDALFSVPFQAVFGYPHYQPWFVLAVLLGNAYSFRYLMRGLLKSPYAVWGATILWLINPYVLFEIQTGRITQAFLWFLPLAFACFLRVERSGKKTAVWAGVWTALQAWTYWFMGWFMALAFAWVALTQWRTHADGRPNLVRHWIVAALACLIVISPALWSMNDLIAAQAVPGVVESSGLLELPNVLGNNVSQQLHGWITTEMMGFPMFRQWFWGAAALLTVFASPGRFRWGGVMLLSMLFAVGPHLRVGDGFPMWNYLVAFHTVPFLSRLWFPYRLIVMAFFAVCVAMGLLMDRWVTRRAGRASQMVLLVPLFAAILGLAEQVVRGGYPLHARELRQPAVYEAMKDAPGGVIELPMMVARVSLIWQPIHGQPLFGGMGENAPIFWPDGFRHQLGNRFIRFLRKVPRDPVSLREYDPKERAEVEAKGMRWVVLDRDIMMRVLHRYRWGKKASKEERRTAASKAVAALTSRLGSPAAVDGSLVVWDLRGEGLPGFEPTEEELASEAWFGGPWEEYEAELDARSSLPQEKR